MRAPHVRFKRRERLAGARERAAIAGDEPREEREREGYQHAQEILPRRERVETGNGKHHGDDPILSGGRRRRASLDLTGELTYHRIEEGVRTGGG